MINQTEILSFACKLIVNSRSKIICFNVLTHIYQNKIQLELQQAEDINKPLKKGQLTTASHNSRYLKQLKICQAAAY